MRKILIFLLCLLCITGCKVNEKIIEVPVEVPVIKTEYVVNNDSVYVHDSIWVYERVKDDTVFIEKYKEHIKYICETDTVIKNDTISVPVEIKTTEYVEVEKKLNWFQQTFIGIGIISLLAGVFYIIFKYLKNKYTCI